MMPLFAPAIHLMQRLRLLPKFALVTLILMVPLLLATALLIRELNKSIEFAQQERAGVEFVFSRTVARLPRYENDLDRRGGDGAGTSEQ